MPPELDTLWTFLHQLHSEAECVTFYDALALTRTARHVDSLPLQLVADWVALHDAPHVTDAARPILARYLQRLSAKQTAERHLAKQLIALKDSGKTLRINMRHTVVVGLDLRPMTGWRWQVVSVAPCLRLHETDDDPTEQMSPPRVYYQIQPQALGRGMCRWEEQADNSDGAVPPQHLRPRRGQPAVAARRSFELFIVVETDP